jgi:hypothetical protein
MARHDCKYWRTFGVSRNGGRAWRYCGFCGRRQYLDNGQWRDEISLKRFAEKWLPTGHQLKAMMTIEVAYPFEFRCYESWNIAIRVRFHFKDERPDDVMSEWQSQWHEDLNAVDAEAEKFRAERAANGHP